MWWIIILAFIGMCAYSMSPEGMAEQAKRNEITRNAPCTEQSFRKDRYAKVTCPNKNHKMVEEDGWIYCRCQTPQENVGGN